MRPRSSTDVLIGLAAITAASLAAGCASRASSAAGSTVLAPRTVTSSAHSPSCQVSPATTGSQSQPPSGTTVQPGPPSTAQLTQVRSWVDCATAANGDSKVEPGVAVLSSRQAAVSYLFDGATADTDVPVIAVEVTGQFNAKAFDWPPGVTPPSDCCTTLIAVYDLATGAGDDIRMLGVNEKVPDLTALGPTAQF